jgi:hypothetical protein
MKETALELSVNFFAATVMLTPSGKLMRRACSGVPVRGDPTEYGTLLSPARARELPGFTPQQSWRDALSASGISPGREG